jgi:hypothetical protein
MADQGRGAARAFGGLWRLLEERSDEVSPHWRESDRDGDAASGFCLLLFLAVLGVVLRMMTGGAGPV